MVRPRKVTDRGAVRRELGAFIESPRAVAVITALIVVNAVALGLETDAWIMAAHGDWLRSLDRAILLFFTFELAIKLYAHRWRFFRSGWNTFDLLIVAIAWVPAAGPLAVLRALRVLRVLRLLSVVPQLRRVITAIGHSIPGMVSVIGVLCLVFYVSAVLCTNLFGQHPDPRMQEWFGSIGASAYTLFQIMTLESWSMGIVRPTMELFPYAWVFFVPFIIVTSFAVLNLFIGIIVDAMQTAQEEPRESDRAEIKQFTHDEIAALHGRFDVLQKQLDALSKEKKSVRQ
ncbi:MAG: ion transporter [Hyphomicrobiaceae bacterium]